MSEHPREHELLLAALLAGERDPVDPEVERRLKECAECHELWDELRGSAAQLERAGAEQRDDLSELERAAPGPGEERLLATLERLASEEARAQRRPRRSFFWLAAAALLLVFGAWGLRLYLSRDEAPTMLGESPFEALLPSGPNSSLERFSWQYNGKVEPDRFFLRIWEKKDGPRGDPILTPRTNQSSWTPSAEERARIPAHILWDVEARDANGESGGFSSLVEASR